MRVYGKALDDIEAEVLGACIENEKALRLALDLLPLNPFRAYADAFRNGVFYVLAGWLAAGGYNEDTNRDVLADKMARLVWPNELCAIPVSRTKGFAGANRAAAEEEAKANIDELERCICPIPDMTEYIEHLCKQMLFPPLALSPASQRTKRIEF